MIMKIILILILLIVSYTSFAKINQERCDLLEDKFNEVLFYSVNYQREKSYEVISKIAKTFTSSELARVEIDGCSGNFIIEAQFVKNAVIAKDWSNVVKHGVVALKYSNTKVSLARQSSLVYDLARAYGSQLYKNYDLAEEYYDWALDLDKDNTRFQQYLAIYKFNNSRRAKDYDKAEQILRDIIDADGFINHLIYEKLGWFFWKQKLGVDTFSLWFDALKNKRLNFHKTNRERAVEYIEKSMTRATDEKLHEYKRVLQGLPTRYPATVRYANAIAGLFKIVEKTSVDDELFIRKAEKEFTFEMEKKLREYIATKKRGLALANLYLGDNLMFRGFDKDAIDIWLKVFSDRGGEKFTKGDDDWFSKRLDSHLDKATSNQVEKYVKLLVAASTNAEANAQTYLNVGEKLVGAGKIDKAIEIWLDGLTARRSPRIVSSEGDGFITKLDNYAENLTQKQKIRYLSILKKQIQQWKSKVIFEAAVLMTSNKYQEILNK